MVLCYPEKDNILGGTGVGPKKGTGIFPFLFLYETLVIVNEASEAI
jgi:hypothetical protein